MRHGSLNVDLLPRQTDQRHKSYTLEIVVQIRLHLSCSLLASAIYYSTKNAAAPYIPLPLPSSIFSLSFWVEMEFAYLERASIQIILRSNSWLIMNRIRMRREREREIRGLVLYLQDLFYFIIISRNVKVFAMISPGFVKFI